MTILATACTRAEAGAVCTPLTVLDMYYLDHSWESKVEADLSDRPTARSNSTRQLSLAGSLIPYGEEHVGNVDVK